MLNVANLEFLTETILRAIINECTLQKNYSKLIHILGSVFFDPEALMKSFLVESDVLTKEDIRSMETDQDKDTDEQESKHSDEEDDDSDGEVTVHTGASFEVSGSGTAMEIEREPSSKSAGCGGSSTEEEMTTLDFESVRRAFSELFAIPDVPFQPALINAITYLSRTVETDLRSYNQFARNPNYINIFLIVMEIPALDSLEFLENATPQFCKTLGLLPVTRQAQLARMWSTFSGERLRRMVNVVQQLITVRVITNQWTRTYVVNDDDGITSAAKLMKILYYASIVGGRTDPPRVLAAERALDDDSSENLQELLQHGAIGHHEHKEKQPPKDDPLGRALNVRPVDCREPLVALEEFVNESLSDAIEMDKDYTYYKAESAGKFTFMQHAFLLTTAVKNMGMYFDNRIRMMSERRASMLQNIVNGGPMSAMPYLRLRIRRDHIIDDALINVC